MGRLIVIVAIVGACVFGAMNAEKVLETKDIVLTECETKIKTGFESALDKIGNAITAHQQTKKES